MFELFAAIALIVGIFVAMITLPFWMDKLVGFIYFHPFLVNRRR